MLLAVPEDCRPLWRPGPASKKRQKNGQLALNLHPESSLAGAGKRSDETQESKRVSEVLRQRDGVTKCSVSQ